MKVIFCAGVLKPDSRSRRAYENVVEVHVFCRFFLQKKEELDTVGKFTAPNQNLYLLHRSWLLPAYRAREAKALERFLRMEIMRNRRQEAKESDKSVAPAPAAAAGCS